MPDEDCTSPDCFGSTEDDPTSPGVGTREAYIATASSANGALDAVTKLSNSCPPVGNVLRDRHLEILAHAWGVLGDLSHDSRRVINRLRREEKEG